MISLALALLSLSSPTEPAEQVDPDALSGAALVAGTTCFDLLAQGRVIGETRQTIAAAQVGGTKVWRIVVHQKVHGGGFEMRDTFVLDRDTLLPFTMQSVRGSSPAADGWQRIDVDYEPTVISGKRENAAGAARFAVDVDQPRWDGNLWGPLFASLPLALGRTFEIPTYQYDKGKGAFRVRVIGMKTLTTPDGETPAWILSAGTDPARLSRYYVAQDRPAELGYEAGPTVSRMRMCDGQTS